jgi:prolyl-tRNA synthetase
MGTVVEVLSDDKGIIWPESIAPFQVHLLVLGEDEVLFETANQLYEELDEQGIEVLYDDRHGSSAGEKFADSDLIGIPYRVVVSKRSVADGGYEVKKRTEDGGKIVNKEDLFKILA